MTQEQSDIPPDSPFATEPLEPKLTLQHLIIWAVCAAVGCSTYGSLLQVYEIEIEGFHKIFVGIDGVIRGTGLASFVLLASRRVRRQIFPRHGGEMLWLLIGIQALLGFLRYPVGYSSPPEWLSASLAVFGLVSLAVWASFFSYAIVRCKQRRWKTVFALFLASNFAAPVLTSYFIAAAPLAASYGVVIGKQLFLLLVVATVATIDLRQPGRFPWTHWAGILLLICQAVNVAAIMLTSWAS